MDDFRSRSCGDGRKQMEFYSTNPQPPPQPTIDFRCYSTSSYPSAPRQQQDRDVKFNKVKSTTNGPSSSSSSASTSVSKIWSFSDPELQRKKRVASYKVYIVEGKMKGSLRKSFRWIKERCSQAVYGWR